MGNWNKGCLKKSSIAISLPPISNFTFYTHFHLYRSVVIFALSSHLITCSSSPLEDPGISSIHPNRGQIKYQKWQPYSVRFSVHLHGVTSSSFQNAYLKKYCSSDTQNHPNNKSSNKWHLLSSIFHYSHYFNFFFSCQCGVNSCAVI